MSLGRLVWMCNQGCCSGGVAKEKDEEDRWEGGREDR